MRETYPKQNFLSEALTEYEVARMQEGRLKATIKVKDTTIHNKKAEICQLREDNKTLGNLINALLLEMMCAPL